MCTRWDTRPRARAWCGRQNCGAKFAALRLGMTAQNLYAAHLSAAQKHSTHSKGFALCDRCSSVHNSQFLALGFASDPSSLLAARYLAGRRTMADADYADEIDRVNALITKLEAAVTGVVTGSASGGGGASLRISNATADKLLLEVDRGYSALGALKRNSKPSRKAAIAEDMARVKAAVDRARKALKDANYAELVGGRKAAAEAEGRDKMVRTTQAAVSGTAKLEAGLGLLTETEDIGVSVIDNMTQQREQLIKTRDKAGDISNLADTAKGIVRGIQARAITNNLILGAWPVLGWREIAHRLGEPPLFSLTP